jgi:hypothetical protein
MYNSDTELLFPLRVIASLGAVRSGPWQDLVEKVTRPDASLLEQTALVLMMVRLGGCVGCNADSFRAMKGCTACARQTIRRFRGGDPELLDLYQQAYREMEQYFQKRKNL